MHLVFSNLKHSYLCCSHIPVARRNVTLHFSDLNVYLIRPENVQACGATYHIQGEFLDETNVDDVVVALVNLAAQVSFCYS